MTRERRRGTYPHELVGEPADPPADPTPDEATEGRAITAAERREAMRRGAGPPRYAAGSWRLARAVERLRGEADAHNPNRDETSDGTIGDAAHASRSSDHNPWVIVAGLGVVRALDLDVDGLPLAAAFERGRQLAVTGKLPQVRNGGYFILNRRITAPDFSGWRVYTGTNPHTGHGHTSTALDAAGFDSAALWGLFAPAPLQPTPTRDEEPVRIISAPNRGVAVIAPGSVTMLSNDRNSEEVKIMRDWLKLPVVEGNDRQFDIARAIMLRMKPATPAGLVAPFSDAEAER